MNKSKVKICSFLMTVLLVLSLAACESQSKENSSPPEQDKSVSQDPVKPEEETVIKVESGSFTGLADSHTVEIIVEGKPMSFQFGEELKQAIEQIKPDQQVEFKYEEKAIEGDAALKQLILTEITKNDEKKSDDKSSGDKTLPDEKKLDVTLEGEKEQRNAKLVRGDGYAMYMFEQFAFDKEKNLLYMNVDPRFKVRIEKLPADFNQDDLMLEGKAELRRYGKVTRLKESGIVGTMKGSRLFLMVQDTTGTYEYIVKELDGNGYIFHVDIPQGEAAEGFAPLAFATLNTIKNQ
ncbi:hypothetical protein J23TS9_21520 [Paenibacillus sp. J23TS9]|uniref:hypothetical protein n=1 Tax=Paenibacillus sp. J23TS9 TaxID=2807193 RepID=UPI001B22C88D|nr:hypothetical protein [Paenibacillus sp. J23TS9]GIP27022.1 hypothetical protein J23TS9_21520 [Paenibacillus sp. J23TS9]